MAPAAAVVVATYNRSDRLARLVAALESQTTTDFEVIIVDDASTDDTWQVLTDLAATSSLALRPIRQERNAGPATARNIGWRSTIAGIVAFTDDDCVPSAEWLAHLLKSAAGHDIVQGRTVPDPAQSDSLGPFSRTLEISHEGYYQTCNVAYRRDVLHALGGFHEAFRYPAGEDTELAWRARGSGATTTFDPDAVVYHDIRPSDFTATFRETWRWQSIALVLRRQPHLRSALISGVWWRRSHRAAVGAVAGLCLTALAPRSRLAWVAGLGLVVPYGRYRTAIDPLPGTSRRQRWQLLPAALAVDTAEVTACVVGSVKHRTLVL